MVEIASGTFESGAKTLGNDSSYAEAEDEDNEQDANSGENDMDAEPLRSSGAKVTPSQEGDRECKANCYAGESS